MPGDKREGRVAAKPIYATKNDKTSNRELWAMVAYYYPQYTLEEASKLSLRDIKLFLRTARHMEAEKYYNLTQIAAAPHTKKGSGIKKLTEHFRREMGR